MADAPKSNPPAEDDMHWGIAYLREDIQELRLGQRSMNDSLIARMDAMNGSLSGRMDAMGKDLIARIDATNTRMDSRFAVLLTAMIGLIGISIGANFTFLQMYLPAQ